MMFASSSHAVVSITAPASYLVLDVETGDAPEEAIASAMRNWRPPANVKDQDKIETRKAEAVVKIRERSALLDAAPLLCVGLQTNHSVLSFNGMNNQEYNIGGGHSIACGDEKGMLIKLRAWLDLQTDTNTVLVGHNVRGFDLPKLRAAFMRYKLRLPSVLAPRIIDEAQSVVDTAQLFRSFSVEHRDDFCPGLDATCAGLGVLQPKSFMSGAEVPRMHREGKYLEILTYNMIDVLATTRVYLLMTGQAKDLQ